MTAWDDDDEVVAWLVSDIEDDLDVGRVGLYEFIWTLRGRYPDAPLAAMKHISQAALARLLDQPNVALLRLTWGDSDVSRVASRDEVTDGAWDDIGSDKQYLAIARNWSA